MNQINHKLRAALLIAILAAPLNALADDAPVTPTATSASSAPEASTNQNDRMELVRGMRARMRELTQTQDQGKRQALMDAMISDMAIMLQMVQPAMGMGSGAGMGMMAPGGGMIGPGYRPNCKMGKPMDMDAGMSTHPMGPDGKRRCQIGQADDTRHEDVMERRLDDLEKRLDIMQMMLHAMAL